MSTAGTNRRGLTMAAGRAPRVQFSPAIAGHDNSLLRRMLRRLWASGVQADLHVDCIFNSEIRSEVECPPPFYGLYLLFDHYRAFSYDARGDGIPGIKSVVRAIMDDHPFRPMDAVLEHYRNNSYRFIFPMRALLILPYVWRRSAPGHLWSVDFQTGEIAVVTASEHPEDRGPRLCNSESSAVNDQLKPLSVSTRFVGVGYRSEAVVCLDGLNSPSVGIVRAERSFVGRSSLPATVVRLSSRFGPDAMFCGAKAFSPDSARYIARCEAIERFHVLFCPADEPLVFVSANDRPQCAIDPLELHFVRPKRGQSLGLEFNGQLPMYWTWASDPLAGRRHLVPAQDVWFNTGTFKGENIFVRCTTNGCALGTSLEEALLFATLEAIERDACLLMWYLQRTCSQIRVESVSNASFQLMLVRARHAFPSYSFHFFDVRADIRVPIVCLVALKRSGAGSAVRFASASRPVVGLAMLSALRDIAVSLGDSASSPPQGSPDKTGTIDVHTDRFSSGEALESLSFLQFDAPPSIEAADIDSETPLSQDFPIDLKCLLLQLWAHLKSNGVSTLVKDITHGEFKKRDACCVKVVGRNLLPMWFGEGYARLSFTPRLRKIYERFAATCGRTAESANTALHPFD